MQRALVTGASRGIGRALVAELAGRGVEVVATARRVDDLADLPAAARLPLDVTSDASVAAAATAAGRIDLLVNNAAVSVAAPVEDTPAEVALAMFDTNVVGPLRLISAFLPGMRERGGGTVVNVSSVAGQAVFPLNGVHSASKHALEALSEALAMEAGPLGIRVLVVQLAGVATGMYQRQERYFSSATRTSTAPGRRRSRRCGRMGRPRSRWRAPSPTPSPPPMAGCGCRSGRTRRGCSPNARGSTTPPGSRGSVSSPSRPRREMSGRDHRGQRT